MARGGVKVAGMSHENEINPIGMAAASGAKFGVKLLETIRDFAEPGLIRKRAQAEADAKRITAQAAEDVKDLKIVAAEQRQLDLMERATARNARMEARRQENIEAIAFNAALMTPPENANADPVDPDWIAAFFDSCKDVSDSEMRTVWGKILANEVAKPGTFSRRALDVVKVLSRADAEAFTVIASHCVKLNHEYYLLQAPAIETSNIVAGAVFDKCLLLESLGLIHTGAQIGFIMPADGADLHYFSHHAKVPAAVGPRVGYIGGYPLSYTGIELLPICGAVEDATYWPVIRTALGYYGFQVPDDTTAPTQ